MLFLGQPPYGIGIVIISAPAEQVHHSIPTHVEIKDFASRCIWHVIQELMKLNEAPVCSIPSSNHSEELQKLSQSMRDRGWTIPEDEADFACYLAEPGRHCRSIDTAAPVSSLQHPNRRYCGELRDLAYIGTADRVLQPTLRQGENRKVVDRYEGVGFVAETILSARPVTAFTI